MAPRVAGWPVGVRLAAEPWAAARPAVELLEAEPRVAAESQGVTQRAARLVAAAAR